jgi:hypothetical protein
MLGFREKYVGVPGEILIFVTVSCPLPQGNRAISAYRSYSADGKTLASGSYDHTVKLWDAQTGREMATLNGRGIVSSVAFLTITGTMEEEKKSSRFQARM